MTDILRDYIDKCMFDMFLHICRQDYVGADDGTSISKMAHAICKRHVKLRIEYKSKTGNDFVIDNPNKLYAKFIGVLFGLSEDDTEWPLSLCSI